MQNFSINKFINNFLNKFFNIHIKKLKRNFDDIISELNKKRKNKNVVILDVGAHEGSSIIRFKEIFKNFNYKIHSFEPSYLFNDLNEKFSNYENVFLHRYAISNKEGRANFFEHISSSGSSSLEEVLSDSYFAKRRNLNNQNNIRSTSVKTTTLDKFCEINNISYISHLKIDVQGHESQVLEGARKLITNNLIDVIETEVIIGNSYDANTSFLEVEKNLIPFGYKLVSISPDGRFYNLESHDILANPELQFDLIYCSQKFRKKFL